MLLTRNFKVLLHNAIIFGGTYGLKIPRP